MYLLLFCYFCLFIFMFKFDLVRKFYALPPSNNERSIKPSTIGIGTFIFLKKRENEMGNHFLFTRGWNFDK